MLMTVCYHHVTYKFHSESTLNSLPECQGTPCLTGGSAICLA